MASSQSTINKYDNINLFKQENLPMLAQQLTMKQGVVDQTKLMLESLQTELGINIDVARDEDKEYLQQRLSQARGLVNNALAKGADISNPTVSKLLFNQMKEVVNDQNILNAVVSTNNVRQLQSEIEWYRQNDPDKYNLMNATVAQKELRKYLNSEGIGQIYNGENYSPYVDINKRIMNKDVNKLLKDMNINAEYVVTENGNGYFRVDNKYEGTVSKERLQQAITAIVGEDGMRQLSIESGFHFGDGSDPIMYEQVRAAYDGQNEKVLSKYKDQIDAYKNAYNTEKNKKTKEKYQTVIDGLQKEIDVLTNREDFNTLVTGEDGTLDSRKFKSIANSMYSTEKMNGWFSLLYQDPLLKESKVNELDYKTKQYALDISKLQLDKDKFKETQINNEFNRNAKLLELQAKGLVDREDRASKGVYVLSGKEEVYTEDKLDIDNKIAREYKDAATGVGLTNSAETAVLYNYLLNNPNWMQAGEITVGDKTIKVNDQTRPLIQKFLSTANGQGGYMVTNKTALAKYHTDIVNAVEEVFKTDKQRFYEFAKRTKSTEGYFKQIRDGEYEWVEGAIKKDGVSNLTALMTKKERGSLTKAEDMTLKALLLGGTLHSLDNGGQRAIMERAFHDEMIANGMGYKAVKSLGKQNLTNTITKTVPEMALSGDGSTAFTPTGKTTAVVINTNNDFSALRGTTFTQKAIDAKTSLDIKTKNAQDRIGNLTISNIKVTQESKEWKQIKNQIELSDKYKDDIFLITEQGNDETLKVAIFVTDPKTKETKVEILKNSNGNETTIKRSSLGGLSFDLQKPTAYDSTQDNPATIVLGSSGGFNLSTSLVYNQQYDNLMQIVIKEFKNLGANIKDETTKGKFDNVIREYAEGKLSYFVAPIGRGSNYQFQINSPSIGVVSTNDLGKRRIHEGDELNNIINTSKESKIQETRKLLMLIANGQL